MKDFRVAVAASLSGKIKEHGFFLQRIVEVTNLIVKKHTNQDYPINAELDQLNYFFSAYLNTIQSLKDACKTAMEVDFSWRNLSPTYGGFIRYCRNAATHDGCHLVNAGRGVRNYIAGPLRRIDDEGNVILFDPPKEDVLTLCLNISAEVLASVGDLLVREGGKIPAPAPADHMKGLDSALKDDFIPDEIKNMILANRTSIEASFCKLESVVVPQTLEAIATVQKFVASARIIRA